MPTDDATLVDWLADRDVACPLCGYNLRGLTAPRCPECGQPLRLGVSLADPYLRAWVTLAVAVLLPAGAGVLWLLIISVNGLPHGPDSSMIVPMCHQMACVPLAAVVLAGRRRVQRWPRAVQKGVATVAVALAVASFGWMFAAISH